MFCMIYVRYIRNDGTDVAVFSNGVSTEDCEVCATSEVAGAANTVHHFATHNMSRVYVAKNIKFNCSIHGNNAKASCDTRVVGNFLRAKNNFFYGIHRYCHRNVSTLLGKDSMQYRNIQLLYLHR